MMITSVRIKKSTGRSNTVHHKQRLTFVQQKIGAFDFTIDQIDNK